MSEGNFIAISEKCIDAIDHEAAETAALLLWELEKNILAIDSLLMDYYFRKRGQVHHILINKPHFKFTDKLSGEFRVSYKVGYSLGCSDNSYEDESDMKIRFKINLENKTIQLAREEFPEREPDEI